MIGYDRVKSLLKENKTRERVDSEGWCGRVFFTKSLPCKFQVCMAQTSHGTTHRLLYQKMKVHSRCRVHRHMKTCSEYLLPHRARYQARAGLSTCSQTPPVGVVGPRQCQVGLRVTGMDCFPRRPLHDECQSKERTKSVFFCVKMVFIGMLNSDWLCITTLHDWFSDIPPNFHPIRSKNKTNRDSHAFSRALRQLHVIWVLTGLLHCLSNLVSLHPTENRSKQELQLEHREHTILLSSERVNKGTKKMNSLSLSPVVISYLTRFY